MCGAWLASHGKVLLRLVLTFCIAASIIVVGLSYSRGALVAMVLGLTLLCREKHAKLVPICFLFVLSTIYLIPDLSNRITGMFAINSDASINNRLVLWQGGAAIFANNWVTGTKRPIGELFSAWYQPVDARPRYSSFVNDYLTIGASYGAFVLFIYLAAILICIVIAYNLRNTRHGSLLWGFGCALIAYLIAGIFNTLYNVMIIVLTVGGSMIVILCYTVFYYDKIPWLKSIASAVGLALVIVLYLGGLGWCFSQNNAVTYEYSQLNNQKLLLVTPKQQSDVVCICLFNEDSSLEFEAKTFLRPLAYKNYNIICIGGESEKNVEALDKAVKYIREYTSWHVKKIILISFDEQLSPQELVEIAENIDMFIIVDMKEVNISMATISIPILLLYNNNIPDITKEIKDKNINIFIESCMYTKDNKTMLINHIVSFIQLHDKF